MATIYQVGPDTVYEEAEIRQDERYEWFVYWYENGGYDGSGEAVALCKEDGLLHTWNLGHCSCYGPLDGWATGGEKVTIYEYTREKDDIMTPDAMDCLKKKVAELLLWG